MDTIIEIDRSVADIQRRLLLLREGADDKQLRVIDKAQLHLMVFQSERLKEIQEGFNEGEK